MPVVLKPENYDAWLDWNSDPALKRLLLAMPSEMMKRRQVSSAIGFREFQGDPRL